MPKTTAVATGLLCLGLLFPRPVHAQAEELPPSPDALGTQASASDVPTPASSGPVTHQNTNGPAPAPAGATPSHQRGIVFAPYLGFNLPMGSTLDNYSLGFRLGALLGWHVTPRISLNGECSMDLMDADTDGLWRPRELYVDVALSPLVHIRSSQIVVGPKVGWFSNARSSPTLTWNGQGILVGLNAGLFIPVRKVKVGGLLSAAVREFTSFSCEDHSTSPTFETCGYHKNPAKTVGLTGAVLF